MRPHRGRLPWIVGVAILLLVSAAHAQVDPHKRTNLEAGIEAPFRGNAPLDGYVFLYVNRPDFPSTDWYSRVIIAPTYVTGEIVRDFAGHAFGLGIDGGEFQNSVYDYRSGLLDKAESFQGGGAGATLSYYWRQLKIGGVVPVEGMLRFRPQYVSYDTGSETSSNFALPGDTGIYAFRAGVRVGGMPPELFPKEALEVSAYHEARYRDSSGQFGLPNRQQFTDHFTQATWGRAGAILPVWLDHTISLFITGGVAEKSDTLSVFRLGGPFRFRAELPLVLHGYNINEVYAKSFGLINLSYRLQPIRELDWLGLQFSADYARVDFPSDHTLPHHNLPALGADIVAQMGKAGLLVLGYGYGFDAPRPRQSGAQEAHIMFEKKF